MVVFQSVDSQLPPTSTPTTPSCFFDPESFGYPSDCPAYTSGASLDTLAMNSCESLCSSRCIEPLLSYTRVCNLYTVSKILKGWCGTSRGNGKLCCTLGTTLSGALSGLGFLTFCDSPVACSSKLCSNAYDSYSCCFANLIAAEPTTLSFNWATCGFSPPDTCLYDPWLLPISKALLIGIVAGGGGLILLCVVCCVATICCCVCGACAGGRKRRLVMGKNGTINSDDIEYKQFP